jgi:uncharacterized BrkB/YihY/UPF0761 family membrane protein
MVGPRSLWALAKSAVVGRANDDGLTMGAAIAYYAVFSLAPMPILVIAIASVVFGPEAAQGAIVAQLGGLMGRDGAAALQAMIESASNTARSRQDTGLWHLAKLVVEQAPTGEHDPYKYVMTMDALKRS